MQEWQNLPPPSSTIGKSINIDFFLFLLESKVVKYQWFVALFFLVKCQFDDRGCCTDLIGGGAIQSNYLQLFAKFWIVLPCITIQCITNNVVQCITEPCTTVRYCTTYSSMLYNTVHLHCTQ